MEKKEINVVDKIKVANYLVIKHTVYHREPKTILVILNHRRDSMVVQKPLE